MREPQEIEDEEHEQVVERVAAVDVAKASGMVCTRVPHRAGHRRRRYQAGEYRLRPATHQSRPAARQAQRDRIPRRTLNGWPTGAVHLADPRTCGLAVKASALDQGWVWESVAGCLAVSGAAVAGGAGYAGWLGAVGREVEVVKVGVPCLPVGGQRRVMISVLLGLRIGVHERGR